MQFWPTLVLGLLSCIVHASPLTINEEKRDDLSYEEMFKQAEHFFPGVWWKSARDTCSEKQFKALYEATSGTIGLLNGLEEKSYGDDDLGLSPAWYHFFMDGKIWQAVRCPGTQSSAILTVGN
ncbi:hypothetical protein NUU61_003043 [Penicillium alfredii]|uniref:Uncharacterized protein n=1 Tax=Penicillium alfredii TaxID=1506179 RepID=A0A9W9FSL9_9EURO|nr:uncharacterized protein NUU61_003043 [Penicillium alfredii]KAJ5105696.1 hypothetical protein NUU61_003043 [Penicillium alfredii]